MKMLVESLKRMYKKGTLTKEQISERVSKGSISVDEYEYITGEAYSGGCRMSPLEIISRLCDVTETLSAIVKKQQTIIEQSKIEEAVRVELRQEVEETDREMDVLEYHMRKYCDTDDIEATEFRKENAVDD